ncbi:MAG: heavy metal translocating P-type ATPase [Pseudomonadota bacterium]
MTVSSAIETEQGCPSGLSPSTSGSSAAEERIDPSPFVRWRRDIATLELAVFGARCAGCIRKIESAMTGIEGVADARLNLSTGRLTIGWRDNVVDPRDLIAALESAGYRAAPYDPATAQEADDKDGKTLLRALAVAGFAAANIMLLSVAVWAGGDEMGEGVRTLMHWVSAVIATPAALYAGRPFFSSAWRALKARNANMDVPISLAVFLTLGLSGYEVARGGEHAYFDAAVMLLFFLLIGRYLDHRLRWRARSAARDLIALQSTTARVLRQGDIVEAVSSKNVAPGDRVLLSPGDRAPVDGVVEEGASYVDVSIVTGESAPERLRKDDRIHAGTLNQTDRLVMRATAARDDSLIAELVRLIEAGEQSKSRYIKLADRAASLYVPIVHSVAAMTFFASLFLGGAGVHLALTNAVAVLIITCPCALGLAAPAVQIVATGALFRRGVLVKSGDALERLAKADAFAFDKTGTLTLGKATLANADEVGRADLQAAAALARVSRHPLSRAVVDAAGPGAVSPSATEEPGRGVAGEVDGVSARFGSADWCGAPVSTDTALEAWFRRDGETPVRFRFEDPLRADADATLTQLHGEGSDVEILSGDRPEVVAAIARRLNVKQWRARMTPAEKSAHLEARAKDGACVAMVGDGLNDAPSLAAAYVSLSPGSAADASQAAADFVYQGDGLEPILSARAVSKSARRRILENYGFAVLYNMCAVPLAAFGFLTPLIAAIAMSGSSLVVTLNALRTSAVLKGKQ